MLGLFFFLYTKSNLFFFFSLLYLLTFSTLIFSRLFLCVYTDSAVFHWAFAPEQVPIFYSVEYNYLTADFSLLLLFLTLNIHVYSYIYFKKDPELSRFALLLGFFVFSMLLMINSTSFVFIFIAWEGVGLFSFLLVSFWYSKVSTFKSGVKVLFYNRLGDFFFFLSLGFILAVFKTDNTVLVSALSSVFDLGRLSFFGYISLKFFLSFCLVIVILSKSAQYGFHIWLLEAMEAPLPASALIHSATLICSGVVLFFKTVFLVVVQPELTALLLLWSSITVCCLSFSAFFNYDIKRILAYSTGSHVSLMLALAVTQVNTLGYLYMLVHASTKVFIFILFGYVIDMNGGVRDLRKMGGFLFNPTLLLLSVWGFAYLSSLPFFILPLLKDTILLKLPFSNFLADLSIFFFMFSTFFNYFYISRLFFKIFFGDRLSFLKTYFKGFLPFNNFFIFLPKNTLSKNLNNPLFYLFVYILFFESNFMGFMDYDFLHLPFSSLSLTQSFVPNPTLKFMAFSNCFFYLLLGFFALKLFL